ncbi:MAG TPA: S-layer protein [Nitrospiraceae bacterium]|nr:MAG: S-layer protein [Nitrospirae bacterium GWA2_46_11]OGW25906.1 MAG: S-layer protein [Nitrospirae bacterium GWB2_47_37]HAK89031.1 S-layer protein [Nitrospiraceae bacterium]HCZ11496.1 S-layer protein [Nitrospiraceae bacterium]
MSRDMFRFLAMGVLLAAFIFGCAPQEAAKCTSPEDNPQHHYLMGMKALEEGKIDVAQSKFERAVYCEDKFAPAYSGLAIVTAERAKRQTDAGFRKVETTRALDNLKKAEKLADTAEDKFDHLTAGIRVYTTLKTSEWLKKAEEAFGDIRMLKLDERKLVYYQGTEAADYFMGIAYLEALEFRQARDKFADVLKAKREGKWHEKAEKAHKRVDKIVRAMAGITVGDVGKQIAVKNSVTRADLAALLIDEMKLDKLFARFIPQSKLDAIMPEFIPADILNHHFREEILTLMKWKIRGFEAPQDPVTKAPLFKPDSVVKRVEMALMLEDILIKIVGDENVATRYYKNSVSDFADVEATKYYSNAVKTVVSTGLMETEKGYPPEFRLFVPVDGADALIAIRELIYIRDKGRY